MSDWHMLSGAASAGHREEAGFGHGFTPSSLLGPLSISPLNGALLSGAHCTSVSPALSVISSIQEWPPDSSAMQTL